MYGALKNCSIADQIFAENSVRALLITIVELTMADASGKINCLLELAIPEIYIISELTVLNLYSDTDLTVPKVEAAGQDLILQCEYHTVVLGKPRDNFRRLDDPLIQLSAPP
jgi:hypothetical protein